MFEKAPQDMADILRDIGKRFSARQSGRKRGWFFPERKGLCCPCDRGWLTEALGNLVKKAFDHTGKGAEFRISWRSFGSIVQVAVSDNGSGIHPEDLPHIFKRFYRSRFSSDVQGTGLGLPLAKAVIEAHNGTIEVDSMPEREPPSRSIF